MLTTIVPLPVYIHLRIAGWVILTIFALVDFIRKKDLRSAGWPLHRAIVLVVNLQTLSEIFVYLFCLFYLRKIVLLQTITICITIFTRNIAYAAFLYVLLMVSSGYCITRDQLAELKSRITYIPLIYFISTTVMDFILFSVNGSTYFVVGKSVPLRNLGGVGQYLLLISLLLYFVVSIMAWFYIFDSLSSEIRKLKPRTPKPIVDQARLMEEGQNSSHQANENGGSRDQNQNKDGEHQIEKEKSNNIFKEVELMEEQEGTDISTVAELMVLQQKRRLMSRFGMGVAMYVLLSLGVLVIPVFVTDAVQTVVIIAQNCAQWIFLAALLWVFRPKQDSPYLQIPTDIGQGGYNSEMFSTQLAVIHEHDQENDSRHQDHEEDSKIQKNSNNNGNKSSLYVPEPKFSSKKQDFAIDDEDEDLVVDDESLEKQNSKRKQKSEKLEQISKV